MDELEVFLSEKHSGQDADFDEVHDQQLRFKKTEINWPLESTKESATQKSEWLKNHSN